MLASLETMPTVKQTQKPMLWTGRILSGLAVLFLAFDAAVEVVIFSPSLTHLCSWASPLTLRPELAP